jgi:cell division transport system permease protein
MILRPRLKFLPDGRQGEGLLPYVIAVMVYLCGMALFAGFSIQSGINNWSNGLVSRVSIQIEATDKVVREQETIAALKMLQATPGIKSAQVIADSEVMKLISPWLGDISLMADLPMPSLIDVELSNPGSINSDALKVRLKDIAPHAEVDDHQTWMSDVLSLASTLRTVALIMVLMVILCTIAIVVFGCRTGLATHKKSVELMHLMGAEDSTIAREFHRTFMMHGLKGGIIGTLLAVLTLYILSNIMENIGEGLLTSFNPDASIIIMLCLLPLFSMGLAMITASLTVRRALLKLV